MSAPDETHPKRMQADFLQEAGPKSVDLAGNRPEIGPTLGDFGLDSPESGQFGPELGQTWAELGRLLSEIGRDWAEIWAENHQLWA